jgi:Mlc titration factor MtfA (ptsG expression regulator)
VYLGYFLAGILVLIVVGLFFSAMMDLFSMFMNVRIVQDIKFTPEKLMQLRGYLAHHTYFHQLSDAGKKRFMHRTINVMVNKKFIGKGIEITEEMRVRLSACIVQLTFGLETYTLPHYDRIYVFPEEYYHPLLKQNLKGGTYANGMISFSWKDFVEGFADPADKYNLGLHEFAHALKLEIKHSEYPDDRFSELFPDWNERGKYELEKMQLTSKPYFRKYAATNSDEFFAVCVEYFFERSEEFRNTLPDLFHHLCWLLNQDPLRTDIDYSLQLAGQRPSVSTHALITDSVTVQVTNPGSPIEIIPEEKQQPQPYTPATYKQVKGKIHWSLIILITGPFVGIPCLFYLMSISVIHGAALVICAAVFGLLNGVTYKYFKRRGMNETGFFVAYSFLGVGIWMTVLLLALNFLVPGGRAIQTEHDVVSADIPAQNSSGLATFTLTNDMYYDYPWINTYWCTDDIRKRPKKVTRKLRTGIFGIETLQSTEFSSTEN